MVFCLIFRHFGAVWVQISWKQLELWIIGADFPLISEQNGHKFPLRKGWKSPQPDCELAALPGELAGRVGGLYLSMGGKCQKRGSVISALVSISPGRPHRASTLLGE